MQNYTFPRYRSITEWQKHDFTTPVNLESFKMLDLSKICACVFQSGHLFHWREIRNFLPDKMLLSTNDVILENALWHVHAFVQLLELIQQGRNEPVYGKLVQDAIRLLDEINALKWPFRESNMALLIINKDKAWSKLSPGQIKLPWLLLAPCNESIRHWLISELILCRQRWHISHPPIAIKDFVEYYVLSVRQLSLSVHKAGNCPLDYKQALEKELSLRTVDAYAWLGKKTTDDLKKLKLYEGALELATQLGKDFPIAKFEKISADTAAVRKAYVSLCGILDYSSCPSASSQLEAEEVNEDVNHLFEFQFI